MAYLPIFKDGAISSNIFAIKDFFDDTKKIIFNATSISSGFSRTITMPDFNVDLTDLYSHASRHLPGGPDALSTAAAIDISITNTEGVAALFARSDHTHRGIRSLSVNSGTQRFGNINFVDGTVISIIDDGSGNFTISSSASGTVTSVGLTVPSFLSVSGSPITTTGTFSVTLVTQIANAIFAGPASGGAASPTFRSLVVADFPTGTPSTQTPDQANAVGVSAQIARADHIHNIPADAPVNTGLSNTEGVAASFARSDHIHSTTIPYVDVNSATAFATTSATDVVVTGFTTTPSAGTYKVCISMNTSGSTNNSTSVSSIYVNGVQTTNTERTTHYSPASSNRDMNLQAIVTVNGSQAIDARVRVSAGTLTIGNRSMILVRMTA